MMAQPLQALDPLDTPVHVTVWPDKGASEKRGGVTTMRVLAGKIKEKSARTKAGLRLLKLATFGDARTELNCLRHNENVLGVTGVEADYDASQISFEDAVERATKSNLACIVYTSPSHTPTEPKWRVVAPFSEELDPGDRDHMMGRLNGAFGGIFAPESWVLSQSYYYGFVEGKEETHQVELIEGDFIDTLDELDEIFIGKPNRAVKHTDSGPTDYGMFANYQPLDVESARNGIRTGTGFHPNMVSLAAHYMGSGHSADETYGILVSLMDEVPLEQRDRRWKNRRSSKHIEPILKYFERKENRKLFRRLREREAREEDAKTLPAADVAAEPEAPAEKKKPTATNALTLRRAMSRFPEMDGLVAFDEFSGRIILQKGIPDPDKKRNRPFDPRPWEDTDDIRLALWFQHIGYLKATKTLANDVVQLVANESRFHPVRDYLDGLTWDKTSRLSQLMTKGFGANAESSRQTAYLQSVSRAWLISAVARAQEPGCKVDTMPILEGPQGALKSSGARALCPNPNWFSDTLPNDLAHKDARQHLPGNWIVEMSELSQMRRQEVESLKSFLSTQTDKYRPSYGRVEIERPRQCVFVGTTNEDQYLSDVTGNRRFWPVRVGKIDLTWIRDNRDQLWAEAAEAWHRGEQWWLVDAAAEYAVDTQQARTISDEWETAVLDFARGKSGGVRTTDILRGALFLDITNQGKSEQMRVSTILKSHGYRRERLRKDGNNTWFWFSPGQDSSDHAPTFCATENSNDF